jgi:hypothetical protein
MFINVQLYQTVRWRGDMLEGSLRFGAGFTCGSKRNVPDSEGMGVMGLS